MTGKPLPASTPHTDPIPWLAAGLVSAAAFAFYVSTGAPDLTLVDSGELAMACAQGYVPHPPGFPLYFILGFLACKISPLSPIRTTTLLSALWTALSAGMLVVLVDRAFLTVSAMRSASLRLAVGVAVASLWITSRNPWTWAGVTEVYALNVFLLAGAFATAWAGVREVRAKTGREKSFVVGAAVFAALGLANHNATALVVAPPLLVLVAGLAPTLLRRRWFWVTCAAAVFGAVALYLVLLAAGLRNAGLDWGGIRDLPLLVRHITGQQYHLQLGGNPEEAKFVTGQFWAGIWKEPGLVTALLVALGLPVWAWVSKMRRPVAVTLGFVAAAWLTNWALSVAYVVGPEDRIAYDLPAHFVWCFAAALGLGAVLSRPAAGVLTALLIGGAGAGWNVFQNFKACNFRDERAARTAVEECLGNLPQGSVVFLTEWNLIAPYFYMRDLENYRTDLHVIDVLMLRRFWYLGALERNMPALVAASRPEFDAFREQVTAFDLGKPYDPARIQSSYEALLKKWIEFGLQSGGAYLDWACAMREDEKSWVRAMTTAPHELLVGIAKMGPANPGEQALLEQTTIPTLNAENLRWLRDRVPDDSPRINLAQMIPRNVQYWKILCVYRYAVEGSMLYAILQGRPEEAEALRIRYADWYPGIEGAWNSAMYRASGGSSGR